VRAQLGWLTFVLAIIFAGGVVLTLIGTTWFAVSDNNGLIGFFGFGIPMIVAAQGTAALWSDQKPLQKTLGWASTLVGLVCGVALFILVAGWVLSESKANRPLMSSPSASVGKSEPNILHFLGFGFPMLMCGGFGIAMLFASEGKSS
jgi:hypothetical protein